MSGCIEEEIRKKNGLDQVNSVTFRVYSIARSPQSRTVESRNNNVRSVDLMLNFLSTKLGIVATPALLVLRKQRQADEHFSVIPSYIVTLKSS